MTLLLFFSILADAILMFLLFILARGLEELEERMQELEEEMENLSNDVYTTDEG